jgi:polynucleotide 5'-kinase involved in rRNA processing
MKGSRKNTWSVTVQVNWRVTFRFEGGNAEAVNYEDYQEIKRKEGTSLIIGETNSGKSTLARYLLHRLNVVFKPKVLFGLPNQTEISHYKPY